MKVRMYLGIWYMEVRICFLNICFRMKLHRNHQHMTNGFERWPLHRRS
jgi:hypothetical protein